MNHQMIDVITELTTCQSTRDVTANKVVVIEVLCREPINSGVSDEAKKRDESSYLSLHACIRLLITRKHMTTCRLTHNLAVDELVASQVLCRGSKKQVF